MPTPRSLTRGAVSLGFLLLAAPALADGPPPDQAQLDYERPAGLASCPEEIYFHHFVAVRFGGIDPFTPTSPRRITVKIHWEKPGFVATLAMYDEARKRMGGADLVEPTCQGVVESAGRRVVSWLIPIVGPAPEPAGAPAQAPAPPPPTQPTTPPALEEPPMPPPGRPEPMVLSAAPPAALGGPRFAPRLGTGARADFGSAWGAIFGVTLEGGFQRREWGWGGWSLMGTFRWAPQQVGLGPPTSVGALDVNASLVAGRLAGCIYRAWRVTLAGCVVGDLGAVQQSAGTPLLVGSHQTALFAGGGVGARVEAPLPAGLYFQMATDVIGVGTLSGSTNKAANVNARRLGASAGGLGAGLGVSF
jgi:hypothetical protein